jgi:sigma-E factor negative regulatory protein RseA
MSDILNEQLSALLDGELPPEETTLLLKRLGREQALAARLSRYRLCGDVLRGERVQPRADFALRVSAAVAAEPALAARAAARPRRGGWLRPLAGLAVAASVAVVAVLVLQTSPGPGRGVPLAALAPQPASAPLALAQTIAARGTTAAYGRGSGEPVSYVTPTVRPRLGVIPEATLASYVVAHSTVSAPLAGRSVLIHLVADETRGDVPAR